MFKIERMGDHNHAAIGINDTRVRFDALTLTSVRIPLEGNGNARIHTAAATLFVKARAERFVVANFYRHAGPIEAMLELGKVRVNGTRTRVATKG